MEANELMIGDWVIVYEKAMPVKAKVEGVYGKMATVLGRQRIVEKSFVEPIPLTPEILEKNGFEVLGKRKYFLVPGDPSLAIERNGNIGAHGNTFTIGHFWDGKKDFRWFIEIDYVHELQHALRLCGIEKEIII